MGWMGRKEERRDKGNELKRGVSYCMSYCNIYMMQNGQNCISFNFSQRKGNLGACKPVQGNDSNNVTFAQLGHDRPHTPQMASLPVDRRHKLQQLPLLPPSHMHFRQHHSPSMHLWVPARGFITLLITPRRLPVSMPVGRD